MLSICIHLDHVLIAAADGVLISELESASIPQIKYMGYKRMIARFYDPIGIIRRSVVHNKHICDLVYLRLLQLFQ